MKNIVILGSTGSIGTNTLDIVDRFPDEFRVVGLTAGSNDEKLEEQVLKYRPRMVALAHDAAAAKLRERVTGTAVDVEVLGGIDGITRVAQASEADLVISSIVGAAGLVPTLAAITSGKHIALANKEPMVMAGKLMQAEAHRHGVRIFPVDSEHSAIFQSMEGHRRQDIHRVILTASGGPLWEFSRAQLADVTPERALQHPNWKMGEKITIDSATLMNKGLEIIEARWLFDIPEAQIDVLIHRESIIHSLVEYTDRSVIAQLGLPDMRTPISYAMRYPERMPLALPSLDLAAIGRLTFFKPDHDRFPCLRLGYEALRIGGTMPATMNAANEVAVEAFLHGGIRFVDIPDIIQSTMEAHTPREFDSLGPALEADRSAREKAESLVHALAR